MPLSETAETTDRILKGIGALHRAAIRISKDIGGPHPAERFAEAGWQVLKDCLRAKVGAVIHRPAGSTLHTLFSEGLDGGQARTALSAWVPKAGPPFEVRHDTDQVLLLCNHTGLFHSLGTTAWQIGEGSSPHFKKWAPTLAEHLALSGTVALRAAHRVTAPPQSIPATLLPFATRAAQGQTNDQIADALGVSTATVARRLGKVYQRLGVTSRHQLNPNSFELAGLKSASVRGELHTGIGSLLAEGQ